MSELYRKIREKKAIWEHDEVKNVIPFISQQLYSSKTQLIFELIQNAEDACTRLKRRGEEKDYFVHFNLKPEFLKVYHNGIPFDDNDVDSICSVLQGTKTDDQSLIGKFGIGFKSVYKYTLEPSIHSNNPNGRNSHHFIIRKFVKPYKISPPDDLAEDQTLIEIPFNHSQKESAEAYLEIGNKLTNLESRSILFLNSISEITYAYGSERGLYRRMENLKDGYKEVTLLNRVNKSEDIEKWLLFEKHIDDNPSKPKVEIAFLISDDKENILKTKSSNLYSYFETEKNTKLHFLIHGPFHTTPARDTIRSDEWNEKIIKELANLIAEILPKIKELGYLNLSFLQVLPLTPEDFIGTDFEPIYKRVKEEFLTNEYLPIFRGGYDKPDNVFLAQISDLRELLSSDDLLDFYNKKGKWLDEEITERRTPDLRQYLIKELDVPEITPDGFGRILTSDNLKNKSDEWLSKLYAFLVVRQNLFQRGTAYRREGVFRTKPIFRTTRDQQIAGIDSSGDPLVFLPSDTMSSTIPTIKKVFMKDETNVYFFKSFGLKEPDKVDYIITKILPKYSEEVPRDENINDVYTIYETLSKLSNKKLKEELKSRLNETNILYAINSEGKKEYKSPNQIYISKPYTKDDSTKIFYEGYSDAWFLSERYFEKIPTSEFIEMGSKKEVIVSYTPPNSLGYVVCTKAWSDHRRGLGGFDPEANIIGLKYVLRNINLEKSQILWNVILKHKHLIHGTVSESSRQDFRHSTEEQQFSKMGDLLVKNKWLPSSNLDYFKPSKIRLTELHKNFEKDSSDAKIVSKKLQMKPEIDLAAYKNMTEDQRTLFERYHMLSKDKQNQALVLLEKLAEEDDTRPLPPITPEDLNKIRDRFATRISSDDDKSLIGLNDEVFPIAMSQEAEEELTRKYGQEMGEYLKKNIIRYRNSIKKDVKVTPRIPPKQFLISQYDGYCQICGTKLDLGKTRNPIISQFKIEERRRKHPWADEPWNNLGLCPNCHALAKQGGLNLQKLTRLANDILIQEATSEFIPDRGKQGYLVEIELASKPKKLFYTQRHMSYVAAFLFYDK
jgi:hypothetical protein